MSSIEEQYRGLLGSLLHNSNEKSDRTGTGTHSIFGRQIRHNMKQGFPLLTTKRMAVKTMMTELKWFLKGDTNIKYLVDNGCNIWNGDGYKNYINNTSEKYGRDPDTYEEYVDRIKTDEHFAKIWGELGPIYGKQWRHWLVKDDSDNGGEYVWCDQIAYLVEQLKDNPDSRRLMVSAWNPGDLPEMALPPCHYGFQVYTRELSFDERYKLYMGKDAEYDGNAYGKISTLDILDDADVPTRAISLMWNQRSVDTFLGLPFNIASYGMLLELLAKECNMVADRLVGNLGDVHIYKNHLKAVKTQLSRSSFNLPALTKLEGNLLNGDFDYTIEYYESYPAIKAPLSN